MSGKTSFSHIVIGLGGLGSAAAYWLTQQGGNRVLGITTCLLTHTPDTDFLLDSLPGHPDVHCVVGANHAMKFASLIGRILADLSTVGRTDHDIEAFRFARPALSHGPAFPF